MSLLGMRSAMAIGGFEACHLYTYQTFVNVPAGIIVHDAASILSMEDFETKLTVAPLAVAADLIRLLAMLQSSADYRWFGDVDTTWMKSVRDIEDIPGTHLLSLGFVLTFASRRI
jgi:hypothetical protein